jgi:hypothetical protein
VKKFYLRLFWKKRKEKRVGFLDKNEPMVLGLLKI